MGVDCEFEVKFNSINKRLLRVYRFLKVMDSFVVAIYPYSRLSMLSKLV